MPTSTGILIISLLASLVGLVINMFFDAPFRDVALSLLKEIDFSETLLNGVLSLLLFAGSLHVNVREVWQNKSIICLLAFLGTAIAIALFSIGLFYIFALLHFNIPFKWCLVLGSILAPTDPVSVVGMLRRIGLPESLQAIFAGESLFNDGAAIVVFGITLTLALQPDHSSVETSNILITLLKDIPGSILLGYITGKTASFIIRHTHDRDLEVIISLALATGTFSLAHSLDFSGPVSVVAAGLSMGHNSLHQIRHNSASHDFLLNFWSLIDEIFNSLLFMLIGLEVLVIHFNFNNLKAAILSIPLALLVRSLSILFSAFPYLLKSPNPKGMFAILTWGGLRGGISLALALALPDTAPKEIILVITYSIIIFTVFAQGLSMEKVVNYFFPKSALKE